jgi:signal transduction histidine kinase
LTLALTAALSGFALEWRWFGTSAAGAVGRTDAEVRGEFDGMTNVLARVASAIAADPGAAMALQAGPDAAKALFDVVDRHSRSVVDAVGIAVTVYEQPGSTAVAWAGRPSDIPGERTRGTHAWFVTPAPLGLRLVHVLPIGSGDRPVGVVAVEYPLSPAPAGASIGPAEYLFDTRVGPASLRMQYEGAGERPRPNTIVLRAPGGDALVEASLAPEQIARARSAWRQTVTSVVLVVLALTLLLLIGPALDKRAAATDDRTYLAASATAVLLLLGGGALIYLAMRLALANGARAHALLLLFGATGAAFVALMASPAARLRIGWRGRRRSPAVHPLQFVLEQILAGIVVAALIALFDRVLRAVLDDASVDLRHFSLHPWSAERLTLLGGILACYFAALWGATLACTTALARWRLRRAWRFERLIALLCWVAPAIVIVGVAASRDWPIPAWGMIASAAVCAVAGLFASRGVAWFRHATVAGRILALFIAFLVPSLLLYPSVNFFTERNVRDVIATRYSVEAQNHYQTLQERLADARAEIDSLPLAEHVRSGAAQAGAPRTDSAFFVWKQTALARERLTSAVELYDATGAPVSRFALNFPEYTAVTQTGRAAASCQWEVFGEAARFGSEERRMLHAERSICEGEGAAARVLGAIVVHVVPDYRTLPFITSQSPYFEVFRSGAGAPAEGTTGNEIAIVIYGWGLTPLYASGAVAWPISEELFGRIYRSREAFWTSIGRGNSRWHVYVSNDRSGIYAIGYPALNLFDRLVHLAELTTLAGIAYLLVLLGTAAFTRVSRERPRVGRALLREIRSSFYRKLLLAFVLASIIPVLTLAFVIRTYFAGLLLENVEAEAARTAFVAQRVIEESAALQLRAGQPVATPTDDDMIWISQVIDQDVNVFQGPRLVATSEYDLFASGLLPTRTPDHVYRAIALQRLPSFVGEDRIGAVPYMIAGAPVRAGGEDAILTVPLANQQREIEREIDELDRGVHLAALFFILLGAAIGLSMAERIADPVRRLTRATRRIARGDFDERVAVRSVDELRRLVDAFNSMAAELKAQRDQLERTHRLEAWAEMARQVAHEIKNPLTPIQLSAEHLRRVHADRGEPMGAVLDSCVTSILGQVRLLRQISSEFSSFASSPTARRAPVDLAEVIGEVVEPYRTGLEGRIEIHNTVAPPLPRVFVDRTLIARALSNIVENALHAMPGQGSLTLTADVEGNVVLLRIRDTGVGMDEEAQARVFEPYFSTKATGTGLGVPIARRNVELSGGEIHVDSEKGRGTTVTLRLPIAT